MNYFTRVDILHAKDELVDVVASLDLMKALATLDQIRQRLVAADIEHDVDILFVLKVSVEARNIFVVKCAMNLDFTGQLLAGFGPGEIGLGHDFESPCEILMIFSFNWIDTLDLVAFGEATLAKESQALVSDDLAGLVMVFGVQRFDFLFDDLKSVKAHDVNNRQIKEK